MSKTPGSGVNFSKHPRRPGSITALSQIDQPKNCYPGQNGEAQMPRKAKQFGFVAWGVRFFAYLVKEKNGTNPALLELIYWLGDDGRQELALSVFNFFRTDLWTEFCRDRRRAKQRVKRNLSRAITNLRRSAKSYRKVLASVPVLGTGRRLGGVAHLHLSDLLEREAAFLAVQARIASFACRKRCGTLDQEFSQAGQSAKQQSSTQLSGASRKLARAARSYRELLTLTSTIAVGHAFDLVAPAQLPAVLEAEAAELEGMLSRANLAFNKKRVGIKADLAILFRLQVFVEAFGLRWTDYLPPNAARNLSDSDIADLLEAGKNARGARGDSTIVDPESIGRALSRFRKRKSNSLTCVLWRRSAHNACGGLRLRPPNLQTPPSTA
jgi:hypothetical protein